MKSRTYLIFYLAGVLIPLLVLVLFGAPAYMDADYYLVGGLALRNGNGFEEMILWNYLDEPAGLPHPSHAYWMPLASIVSALGLWLNRLASVQWAARSAFILLAGLIPVLSVAIAYRVGRQTRPAILAGWLSLLPGFYLPFYVATDTFVLYMVLGGLFIWVMAVLFGHPRRQEHPLREAEVRRLADRSPGETVAPWLPSFGLGVLAGGLHLSRADGAIWLIVAVLAAWVHSREQSTKYWIAFGVVPVAGYLLVMMPWFARNAVDFGVWLAPGGIRALWFTEYDQLFAYPAHAITAQAWLASGWQAIVQARLWALGQNLQSALAVQGQIFLAPLVAAGYWIYRRQIALQLAALAWLLTFAVMTLIFPFAGARGGYFHSAAALQPLIWALAALGFEAALGWAAARRSWRRQQARRFFSAGLIALALFLSVFVLSGRARQETSTAGYVLVEQALASGPAQPEDIVMVNNPPAYFLASGRPAIVIPDGGLPPILRVGEAYGARFLLLEAGQGLDEIYSDPAGAPGLNYLFSVAGVHIFEVPGAIR